MEFSMLCFSMLSKHSNFLNYLSKASFCQPLNVFFFGRSPIFKGIEKMRALVCRRAHHWLVPTEDTRKARTPSPALLLLKPIGQICQTAKVRPAGDKPAFVLPFANADRKSVV